MNSNSCRARRVSSDATKVCVSVLARDTRSGGHHAKGLLFAPMGNRSFHESKTYENLPLARLDPGPTLPGIRIPESGIAARIFRSESASESSTSEVMAGPGINGGPVW